MSDYYLTIDGTKPINFAPETLEEELKQNLFTILTTWIGSVVLNRSFGMDPEALDHPGPVAQALIASQIYDLVERYEPRILIQDIQFLQPTDDPDAGRVVPVIYFTSQEVGTDGAG